MFSIRAILVGLFLALCPLAHAQEAGEENSTEVTVTDDEVTVTVTVTPARDERDAESPTYSAVIGIGLVYRDDDVVDFKPTENYLFVNNSSRVRPSLSPGLMASLGKGFSALVTPNFEARTTAVFDGVMVGLAYRVKSVHVGGGYVVRLGEELGDGFRARVGDALREHPEELEAFAGACSSDFVCSETPAVDEALDGFPLVVAGERVFPGNPVKPSINRGFFLGVFVPFRLRALFQ